MDPREREALKAKIDLAQKGRAEDERRQRDEIRKQRLKVLPYHFARFRVLGWLHLRLRPTARRSTTSSSSPHPSSRALERHPVECANAHLRKLLPSPPGPQSGASRSALCAGRLCLQER